MEAMSLKIRRARFVFEKYWSGVAEAHDDNLDHRALNDRYTLVNGTPEECAEVYARLGRAAEA